jgi:hypothetical protein
MIMSGNFLNDKIIILKIIFLISNLLNIIDKRSVNVNDLCYRALINSVLKVGAACRVLKITCYLEDKTAEHNEQEIQDYKQGSNDSLLVKKHAKQRYH